MKLIWICHLEKNIFFYTGAGGSRRSSKAVTVTGWLPKPYLRRRNTSLPRGTSSGSGGGSSGPTLERGFNSTGTHTCSLALLLLRGSNCLWYHCPWVAWLEVLKLSTADLISLAKNNGNLPPSSRAWGFFASSSWLSCVRPLACEIFWKFRWPLLWAINVQEIYICK